MWRAASASLAVVPLIEWRQIAEPDTLASAFH
jgi:hypothetical protein